MSDANTTTFSGRLQVPVVNVASNEKERLVVDFEFDTMATGDEIAQSIASQLAESGEYTIDLGTASSLSEMCIRLKDLPGDVLLPASQRLVSDVRFADAFFKAKEEGRPVIMLLLNPKRAASSVRRYSTRRGPSSDAASPSPEHSPPQPTRGGGGGGGGGESLLATLHLMKDSTPSQPVLSQATASVSHSSSASASRVAADTSFGVVMEQSLSTIHTNDDNVTGAPQQHGARYSSQGSFLMDASPPGTKLSAVDAVAAELLRRETLVVETLEAMFGPAESSKTRTNRDWLQLLRDVPVRQATEKRGVQMIEDAMLAFKKSRLVLLPTRRHWVHFVQPTPTRSVWIAACDNEVRLLGEEKARLSISLQQEVAHTAHLQQQHQSLQTEVEKLTLGAAVAREKIRRRDDLQERLTRAKQDMESLRGLEATVYEKLREQLKKSRDAAPPPTALPPPPPPPSVVSIAPVSAPAGSVPAGGSVPADDVYFDEEPLQARSDDTLGFLSPNLRQQVSAVLHQGPLPANVTPTRRGEEPSGTSPTTLSRTNLTSSPNTSGREDLKALAEQLSRYLSQNASPDPAARQQLLLQVRKAREAVLKHQQSSSSPLSPLSPSFGLASYRRTPQAAGAPASSSPLWQQQQPLFFFDGYRDGSGSRTAAAASMPRAAPSGAPVKEEAMGDLAASLRSGGAHRYFHQGDATTTHSGGSLARHDTDASTLAEQAVLFPRVASSTAHRRHL